MELPTATYTWNLDTSIAKLFRADRGDYYESPIFLMHGCKWAVVFTPNYRNSGQAACHLNICSLPSNISKINTKRSFSIDKAGKTKWQTFAFSKDKMSIGIAICNTESIANETKFKITLIITILDVYDLQQNEITAKYIKRLTSDMNDDNDEKLQQLLQDTDKQRLDGITLQMDEMMRNIKTIQNTLQDVMLQINEEKKENNNDDLRKEIDKIKEDLKILLRSNNKLNNNDDAAMDKEKEEFKNWIEKELKLPQYYDVFVANGITTLNVVQLLTKEELNDMGITKIGHKLQILKQVQILQQNVNNLPQEGGTGYM